MEVSVIGRNELSSTNGLAARIFVACMEKLVSETSERLPTIRSA
jgi:hypothetical protein